MIHIVNSANDINPLTERLRNNLYSMSMTIQPFIILLGEDYLSFTEILVILDDNKYKVNSFVKALDITFKIFYSLSLSYPKQSAKVWTFI